MLWSSYIVNFDQRKRVFCSDPYVQLNRSGIRHAAGLRFCANMRALHYIPRRLIYPPVRQIRRRVFLVFLRCQVWRYAALLTTKWWYVTDNCIIKFYGFFLLKIVYALLFMKKFWNLNFQYVIQIGNYFLWELVLQHYE